MKRYLAIFTIVSVLISQAVYSMDNEPLSNLTDRQKRSLHLKRLGQQVGRRTPLSNHTTESKKYEPVGLYSHEDKEISSTLKKQIIKCLPKSIKAFINHARTLKNIDLYYGTEEVNQARSFLLIGPPGNGKTTIAKIIGLLLTQQYYFIEGQSVPNEYQNSGPKNLERELKAFISHNNSNPCTIIIDEVDTLTDNFFQKNGPNKNTAQSLWQKMGKLEDNGNFFICASNKNKDELPAQFISRFKNNIVFIPNPNFNLRKSVIVFNLSKSKNKLKTKDINTLATKTKNKSIRDIEALFYEASKNAAMRFYGDTDLEEEIQYCGKPITLIYADFNNVIKNWDSPYSIKALCSYVKKHKQTIVFQVIPIVINAGSFLFNIYSAIRQWRSQDKSYGLSLASFVFNKMMSQKQFKLQQNSNQLQRIGTRMQFENALKNDEELPKKLLNGQARNSIPEDRVFTGKENHRGRYNLRQHYDTEDDYLKHWKNDNKKAKEEEQKKSYEIFLANAVDMLSETREDS